jgi:hypothetical protein
MRREKGKRKKEKEYYPLFPFPLYLFPKTFIEGRKPCKTKHF